MSFKESRNKMKISNESITPQATLLSTDIRTNGLSDNFIRSDKYKWYENYSDYEYSTIDENKNIVMKVSPVILSHEENSEFIPFEINRFYDGIDLMGMKIYIHYVNSANYDGYIQVRNVSYNNSKIRFGWLVDNNVTNIHGEVTFEIFSEGLNELGDKYNWRSKPNGKLNILESLSGNGMAPPSPDRYTQVEIDISLCGERISAVSMKTDDIQASLVDLQAYIGYTSPDIVGVEVDFKNKRFTRLAGALNRTQGANFDNINAFGGRRRCNLTNEGKRLAYYGETGYSETGKLTQAVVLNGITYDADTIVQVMVEQPKFYYKVVPLDVEPITGGKGFHMRKGRYYVSDVKKDGFKLHPAFISNGIEKNFIYLSAYEGCLWDTSTSTYIYDDAQIADFATDMLSSISGAKPISGMTQKLTRGNTRLLAQKRGVGWQQETGQAACATELLFLVEYASFNMQEKIGAGVTNKPSGTGNESEITDSTSSLGNATGAVTNEHGFNVITYRGEENFYGNIWKFIDGFNINAKGIHEVYVADSGFIDDKITDNYKNAGITLAKTNGYVSAFGYNEPYDWLFFVSETFGNTSLPVGDYFYQNNAYNGIMIALLGGYWSYGVNSGGFYWAVDNVSGYRYRNVGGRLVYVP